MPKVSAGLLMFRRPALELFIAHPGGPYFRRRDAGWWTIPKGEPDDGEALEAAACREFTEETGLPAPALDQLLPLGSVRQKGGKVVHAWAFETTLVGAPSVVSNEFELEWPPRSGRRQRFPEIDRAEFVTAAVARARLNTAQLPFVDRLIEVLRANR